MYDSIKDPTKLLTVATCLKLSRVSNRSLDMIFPQQTAVLLGEQCRSPLRQFRIPTQHRKRHIATTMKPQPLHQPYHASFSLIGFFSVLGHRSKFVSKTNRSLSLLCRIVVKLPTKLLLPTAEVCSKPQIASRRKSPVQSPVRSSEMTVARGTFD